MCRKGVTHDGCGDYAEWERYVKGVTVNPSRPYLVMGKDGVSVICIDARKMVTKSRISKKVTTYEYDPPYCTLNVCQTCGVPITPALLSETQWGRNILARYGDISSRESQEFGRFKWMSLVRCKKCSLNEFKSMRHLLGFIETKKMLSTLKREIKCRQPGNLESS